MSVRYAKYKDNQRSATDTITPHPVPKTKRETAKHTSWQQPTKGTRGKLNEKLFPTQVVIQLPKIY